ncbi:hypothetical protein LPN04_27390 [Rugamonas sp. A1-17]|nr:hypothetical protein [Rugamonas sp. A1-17]
MSSGIVGFFKFHLLRIMRAQPVSASLTLMTVLMLAVGVAVWLEACHQLESTNAQLAQLQKQAYKLTSASRMPVAATMIRPVLPWFQSAELSDQLRRVADASGVPYDEVNYNLEDGAQQPFLRYRINMTVAAGYPAVRRFVAGLQSTLANIELDAITCKRADIATMSPTCELAFSAFFRKDVRG